MANKLVEVLTEIYEYVIIWSLLLIIRHKYSNTTIANKMIVFIVNFSAGIISLNAIIAFITKE